ncbi:MAG: hypothetical protein ACREQI_16935, partial [Candidatus Binataceae bacterium]
MARTSASRTAERNAPPPPKLHAVNPSKPVLSNAEGVTFLYGNLPLSFEPNRGQTDSRVKFLSRGPGYTLFLTPDGATLALRSAAPSEKAPLPDRERVRGAALASLGKRRDAGVRVRSRYNSFSKVPHLSVMALA